MALEFLIKFRKSHLVTNEGQTFYYPYPKMKQHTTTEMVVNRIMEATSLARGDVRNAMISLAEVVCDELSQGHSVDLGELGTLRVVVSPRFAKSPEEVTVENSLKTPQIRFTPKKRMLQAAKRVRMLIDHTMVFAAGKKAKEE